MNILARHIFWIISQYSSRDFYWMRFNYFTVVCDICEMAFWRPFEVNSESNELLITDDIHINNEILVNNVIQSYDTIQINDEIYINNAILIRGWIGKWDTILGI